MTELPYKEASLLIKEADILLFRGSGWYSKWIKWAGRGKYSHAGVASGWNGHTECLEFREGVGGRAVNLKGQVDLYPGEIDVYTISDKIELFFYEEGKIVSEWKEIDRKAITSSMREITGEPYSWWRIWDLAKYHIPILRFFKKYTPDDKTTDLKDIEKVCSTVSSAVVRINYVDLIPNLSDMDVTPSDLSRSPHLHYLFTLVP